MKQSKKTKQLGINSSTASHRLIKDILWNFIVKTNQVKCFKCGEDMCRSTFSIEHKEPWLDSENPLDLYFNLENITFSHLKCNAADRRITKKDECGYVSKYAKGCRCTLCVKSKADSRIYDSVERKERYTRLKSRSQDSPPRIPV